MAERIIDVVAGHYGVSRDEVLSQPSRAALAASELEDLGIMVDDLDDWP